LFGQSENLGPKQGVRSDSYDRPDWGIIKIAALYANQPWPDALVMRLPTYEKRPILKGTGLSIIGHPWGTTLKEAHPGDSAILTPYNANVKRPIPYQNSWRHNIRINHGSSGSPVIYKVDDNTTEVVGIAVSIRTWDLLLNSGFELSKHDAAKCRIVPYQDNSTMLFNATNNETWYALSHRTNVSMFVICRPNKDNPFTAGRVTVRFVVLDQTGAQEREVNTDAVVIDLTTKGENIIEFTPFNLAGGNIINNNTGVEVGPWDTIRAELIYETPPATRWAATLSLDYLCIGYCYTPPGIATDTVSARGSIIAETGVVLHRYSVADYSGREPLKFQAPKGGAGPAIVNRLGAKELLPADMKERLAGDMS